MDQVGHRRGLHPKSAASILSACFLFALMLFRLNSEVAPFMSWTAIRKVPDLSHRLLDEEVTNGSLPPSTKVPAGKGSTFLLGIFSVEKERSRRDLIRRTMLAGGYNSRICSLDDYMKGKRAELCQVVYTFVLGHKNEGPTEHTDSSQPIAIDRASIPQSESDVTYLNIKENMEDGKSPTWFKYASGLIDEFSIDYVAKIDSDTLISISHLLSFINEDLPPKSNRPGNRKVFGGVMVDSSLCGGSDVPHCAKLMGKVYMAGQFYFLSSDLAKHVSSIKLERSGMSVGIEDYDMGIWVLSHPGAVTLIPLSNFKFWIHPLKADEDWKKAYADHFELTLPLKKPWWPHA